MQSNLSHFPWFGQLQQHLSEARTTFVQSTDNQATLHLLLISGSLLCLAALLAAVAGYHGGFFTLNHLGPLLPGSVWQMVTFIGDTAMGLCLMLFFAKRNPAILWVILLAALYGMLVSHGLKQSVAALRPPAVLAAEQFNLIGPAFRNNSFPSGHTFSTFILVTSLFYFARQRSTRLSLLVLGLMVGLSRIMVGVHWPVDVLVGAALAIPTTLLAIYSAKRWHWGFRVSGHLFVLSLLIMASISLYWHNGGYPAATVFGQLIASSALLFCLVDYLAPAQLRQYLRILLPVRRRVSRLWS